MSAMYVQLRHIIASEGHHLESIVERLVTLVVGWVQGKEVIAFERHLSLVKKGGNHCHINVVSIPASAAPKAKQVPPSTNLFPLFCHA